ncbi:MAG: DUF885 domain-containing protein, partial [Chloroflexota bacterium]|nr:DUF885 domain-containing protein [Chloroflexota bacterium]
MSAFTIAFDTFLDEFVALHPTAGTAIGDHRHDARWPDASPAGRERRRAFIDRWTADFEGLDPADLEPDEAIDRDLLLGELAAFRFEEVELQEERWDPLVWI